MKSASLALGVCCAAGCGEPLTTAEEPASATLPADRYDAAFSAAVRVLREARFEVVREDRSHGRILTRPRIAASVLEPWQPDHTADSAMAWANTINLQRRVVLVRLAPAADMSREHYILPVEVRPERRQRPEGDAATLGLDERQRRRQRLEEAERGREAIWRPVGRDPLLEKRLLEAMVRRWDRTAKES